MKNDKRIEKLERLREGYDEIDTLVEIIDKVNEIIDVIGSNRFRKLIFKGQLMPKED